MYWDGYGMMWPGQQPPAPPPPNNAPSLMGGYGAPPPAPAPSYQPQNGAAAAAEPPRKRKRKSRWGSEQEEKAVLPGMPTVVPPDLTPEQETMYIVQLQIEEFSRRLRSGDLGISATPEDRSPSPEPIYNTEGKRLNTREYRTRKKLEEERHNLILRALSLNPEYKPPADYKPPMIRVNDKVPIPQDDHPDINFVGLLIGPRGNTLKTLEKETGAKIIIRGKGSVKEGKIGRKDGQPLPGEDEPLHAYVTANNPEHVRKAVIRINEIIAQGIDVPEGQNDLRRQQLRELALLNGTLRENDGLTKLKQLQEAQTIVTNTILCTVCGGTGHLSQDCKERRPGDSFRGMAPPAPAKSAADKAKMDSEYMSLMAELGEGPPPEPAMHMSGPPPSVRPPGPPTRPPMGQPPWQSPPGPGGAKPPSLMANPIPRPPALMSQGSTSTQSPPSWSPGPPGARPAGPPPHMMAPPPPPPPSHQPPPPHGWQPRGGAPPPWHQSPSSRPPWHQSGSSPRPVPPPPGPPPGYNLSAPPPPPPPN